MRRFIIFSFFLIVSVVARAQTVFYKEPCRPQYHFTPAIDWMNDPNGLVYHNGEYHLFYQFNPMGIRWGHMSWGHATSRDLVHWEHLPVAIAEEKDTMIFSGSCVVDSFNTSGFATKKGQVPMVAIYTGHIEGKNQSQHIAYSLDNGITWTKYNHNPVLDLGKKDFRDPKVSWYAPQQKWVMAVMWPIEKQVQFYQSHNLKQWELMSSFGPAGDTTGIWECPDLFKVPIENEPGKYKWVFMHSPAPYMQYFVGEFDGTSFTNENPATKIYRPDYGPDYYAAISFNNLPAHQSPVTIGWANNWNYAQDIPTMPWRSMTSLPKTMSVKKINGEWILLQKPVKQLEALRYDHQSWSSVKPKNVYPLPAAGQSIELSLTLTPSPNSISGVRIAKGNDHYFEIGYDAATNSVYVNRSKAGDTSFSPAFAKMNRYETVLVSHEKQISLHIFFDQSIVEVFANNGEAVLTTQIFPNEKDKGIELFSTGSGVIFNKVEFWKIKPAW